MKIYFDTGTKVSVTAHLNANTRMYTVVILNGANIALNLFTSLVLVRLLSKHDYGYLISFYAGFGLVRLLINLGLGTNVSREIAQSGANSALGMVSFYSTGLIRVVSVSIVGFLAFILYYVYQNPVIFWIAFAAGLGSMADFVHAALAGLRNYAYLALMAVIQPLVYFCLTLVAIALPNIDVGYAVSTFLLSFAVMFSSGSVLLWRSRLLSVPQKSHFQFRYIYQALSFILATYAASLLSQAWSSMATGSLGLVANFEGAAEFGTAFSVANLPVSVIGPVLLTIYFPKISFLLKSQVNDLLHRYLQKTSLLIFSFLSWTGLSLYIFAPLIMRTIFGVAYAGAAYFLQAMALMVIASSALAFFTLTLFGIGKPWRAIRGLLTQIVILVSFILYFSPQLNGQELAWGAVASAVCGAIVQVCALPQEIRKSLFAIGTVSTLMAWAVVFAIILIVTRLPLSQTHAQFIQTGLLTGFTSILIIFLLKAVRNEAESTLPA